MFKCEVCGCEEARTELVSDIFLVEGKRILVEQIPARVCTVWGSEHSAVTLLKRCDALCMAKQHLWVLLN